MEAPLAPGAIAGEALAPRMRRVAIIAVTSLFFMWGFMTCLNDILVPQLKAVFNLNYLKASLIQFCFFGAYFIMSLPAGMVVARWGYQRGMVAGLLTTGLGAWLFYPAATLLSYPLFLGALFVLATGITLLQVSANPYISALGNPATASSRLNLAQAFNSLGTTVAPRIGGWLILSAVPAAAVADKLAQAASVKLPYLGLGLIAFFLAAIMAFLRLPVLQTVEDTSAHQHSVFDALKVRHTALAVVAIFLYVGAEVSIGSYLINYLGLPGIAGLIPAAAAIYVSGYWGGAMAGRFIGAALMQKLRPHLLLGFNAVIAAGLCLCGTLLSGHVALWAVIAIGFFNSIMFPTIFTLGIAGLGHRTSQGSSLLVMAIVGGAIVPIFMGQAADMFGLQVAMIIPALCYLYIVYYAFGGSQPRAGEIAA
jgi:FHS family L-fucose permease-like MFS transporter